MKRYVATFAFSLDEKRVALIRKNKPEWQKGYLNGIGGKVEEGETNLGAAQREFQEETGVLIPWEQLRRFCILRGNDFEVVFFRANIDLNQVRTTTDEHVFTIPVHALQNHPIIPNLAWLIPMALERSLLSQEATYIVFESER